MTVFTIALKCFPEIQCGREGRGIVKNANLLRISRCFQEQLALNYAYFFTQATIRNMRPSNYVMSCMTHSWILYSHESSQKECSRGGMCAYLFSLSVLMSFPFFFQNMVGLGLPLGGAQLSLAVEPFVTPTSTGSIRNFSRKTEKKEQELWLRYRPYYYSCCAKEKSKLKRSYLSPTSGFHVSNKTQSNK